MDFWEKNKEDKEESEEEDYHKKFLNGLQHMKKKLEVQMKRDEKLRKEILFKENSDDSDEYLDDDEEKTSHVGPTRDYLIELHRLCDKPSMEEEEKGEKKDKKEAKEIKKIEEEEEDEKEKDKEEDGKPIDVSEDEASVDSNT
ncbi:protein pxr1-like [Teleopsis dalmanni]|uniref:protein pxr1-like n=1 Tax=Teleopsis dalmanni TaxID=139649 RepID=UPI0018CE023C|nr:protein pxr1-like [Teleopsis dalmanni]XP_037927427.1 protein pxr1-like [Teleopsis dalmanni]